MGLDLAQPMAQTIWAGPGRPKSALGRTILAQTHPYVEPTIFRQFDFQTHLKCNSIKNMTVEAFG